jgi:FkbM family methyltransferase
MKTIFDIGLHTGQDTAFYLALGFKVVALEANPELIAQARARYGREVEEGQLVLVEGCIAEPDETKAETEFWVNEDDSALSSFDSSIAGRMGHRLRRHLVMSVTMAELLKEHGTPHYAKIDIEGADQFCCNDLDPQDLPQYLSTELSDFSCFSRLHQLGYVQFKVIEQRHLTALSERIPINERLLTNMCRNLSDRNLLKRIGRRISRWLLPIADAYVKTSRAKPRSQRIPEWAFPEGSSGPFGEESPGEWLDIEEAVFRWTLHLRACRQRKAELWCDLHAKREKD